MHESRGEDVREVEEPSNIDDTDVLDPGERPGENLRGLGVELRPRDVEVFAVSLGEQARHALDRRPDLVLVAHARNRAHGEEVYWRIVRESANAVSSSAEYLGTKTLRSALQSVSKNEAA